jgi:hypothetical protein
MRHSLLFRVFLCVGAFCFCVYEYIDMQNEITKKRLAIPLLAQQVKLCKEKNTCLRYEIDRFESPQNLLQLAASPQYAHLKQPMLKDVIALQELPALSPAMDKTVAKKDSVVVSSSVLARGL